MSLEGPNKQESFLDKGYWAIMRAVFGRPYVGQTVQEIYNKEVNEPKIKRCIEKAGKNWRKR